MNREEVRQEVTFTVAGLTPAKTVPEKVVRIMDFIDQAVAEAEARMREHYRPAVRALAYEARWDAMAGRVVSQRGWLTEHQIVGLLADECIAAAEAET